MKSRSKFQVDFATVSEMTQKAGIGSAESVEPLGAGEFNTVLAVRAGGKDYALKIAPAPWSETLSYERDMMRAEVFWYDVLAKRTDIAVPEIYFADFSRTLIPTDWFLMQKVDGAHPTDKAQKAELCDYIASTLAKMHRVHGEKFGYEQGRRFDDWHAALRDMVTTLLDELKAKNRTSRRGEKLLALIDRHADILKKAECTMVNYDLWTLNIIASEKDGKTQFTLIDPERCFWGDRTADFVCMEILRPLSKKRASLAAYNKVADVPFEVTCETKIRYGLMTAYMGLLQETEKHYRYTPAMWGWWRNVISGAMFYRAGFSEIKKAK